MGLSARRTWGGGGVRGICHRKKPADSLGNPTRCRKKVPPKCQITAETFRMAPMMIQTLLRWLMEASASNFKEVYPGYRYPTASRRSLHTG